eukprot:CFRG1212T1
MSSEDTGPAASVEAGVRVDDSADKVASQENIYVDGLGVKYEWDYEKQEWFQHPADVPFTATKDGETLPENIYIDEDGVKYEWDYVKQAWLPQVDDDLIAQFQNNYASVAPESKSAIPQTDTKKRSIDEVEAEQHTEVDTKAKTDLDISLDSKYLETPKDKNPNVYITGLPLDVTREEMAEFMKKCGIIKVDDAGEPRIKIYTDKHGNPKGDGLCTYLKVESVDLAMDMLQGAHLRVGVPLVMQRAKFELKGDKMVDKKKNNKKKKGQKGQHQANALSWEDRESVGQTRKKAASVVVLKNMFNPGDFDDDPVAITEISEDVRIECGTCGEVRKVIVFDRHTEGVVSVRFADREHADKCIKLMHGRWFGGRKIHAEHWDGKADYKVEETDHEKDERLKQWDNYLLGAKQDTSLENKAVITDTSTT